MLRAYTRRARNVLTTYFIKAKPYNVIVSIVIDCVVPTSNNSSPPPSPRRFYFCKTASGLLHIRYTRCACLVYSKTRIAGLLTIVNNWRLRKFTIRKATLCFAHEPIRRRVRLFSNVFEWYYYSFTFWWFVCFFFFTLRVKKSVGSDSTSFPSQVSSNIYWGLFTIGA